jgi:hypothetical protein
MKIYARFFHLVATCLLLSLTACASQFGPGVPINHGNYVPDVNLKGEALKTYYDDVATCQRQIIQQYGNKYTTNNAIADVRQCLIKKGHVLLS